MGGCWSIGGIHVIIPAGQFEVDILTRTVVLCHAQPVWRVWLAVTSRLETE